jgi:hypothetical protein
MICRLPKRVTVDPTLEVHICRASPDYNIFCLDFKLQDAVQQWTQKVKSLFT